MTIDAAAREIATASAIQSGGCIEVCLGDKLIGYVIKFSGGWDGWCRGKMGAGGQLSRVASNFHDPTEAIAVICTRWSVNPPNQEPST